MVELYCERRSHVYTATSVHIVSPGFFRIIDQCLASACRTEVAVVPEASAAVRIGGCFVVLLQVGLCLCEPPQCGREAGFGPCKVVFRAVHIVLLPAHVAFLLVGLRLLCSVRRLLLRQPPPCIGKLRFCIGQFVLRVPEFLNARLLRRDQRPQPRHLLSPLRCHGLSIANRCLLGRDFGCLGFGLVLLLSQLRHLAVRLPLGCRQQTQRLIQLLLALIHDGLKFSPLLFHKLAHHLVAFLFDAALLCIVPCVDRRVRLCRSSARGQLLCRARGS